jgi:hypothetical protein
MPKRMAEVRTNYPTWYDFKRVLESKSGHALSVSLWLRIKPHKPLPWNDADLAASYSEVIKIKRSLSGSNQ